MKMLKENPMGDHHCYSHQRKHCKKLLSIPFQENGKLMSWPTEGSGACHAVRAQRHLEKHCNELGRSSIAKRTNEKIKMKKHEEEVTAKVE